MSKSDFGVEFSQSGVPVVGAPDYRKTIDTRWKLLPIAHEGEVTIEIPAVSAGSNDPDFMVFNHNMGFFPAFEAYWTDPEYAGIFFGNGSVTSTENDLIFGLSRDNFEDQPATSTTIKYRIYDLNMGEAYEAPTTIKLGSGSGSSEYGLKFVRDRHRIDDTDPRAFSLDTTMKQIGVHKVQPFDELAVSYTIDHNLGYPPTFLTASPSPIWKDVGFNGRIGRIQSDIIRSSATTTQLTITGLQALVAPPTIVILKDPAEIAG